MSNVKNIALSEINEDRYPNPRQRIEAKPLNELIASIEVHGLYQPIGLAGSPKAGYGVIWGFRRLQAFRKMGQETIPAVIVSMEEADVPFAQVTENIQREALSEVDEAELFARMQGAGFTVSEVARRIGKSKAYVSQRRSILESDRLKELVSEGLLSMTAAREVAPLPKDQQEKVLDAAEKAVEKKTKEAPKPPTKPQTTATRNKEVTKQAKLAKDKGNGKKGSKKGTKVGEKAYKDKDGKAKASAPKGQSMEERVEGWKAEVLERYSKEYSIEGTKAEKEEFLSGVDTVLEFLIFHGIVKPLQTLKFKHVEGIDD